MDGSLDRGCITEQARSGLDPQGSPVPGTEEGGPPETAVVVIMCRLDWIGCRVGGNLRISQNGEDLDLWLPRLVGASADGGRILAFSHWSEVVAYAMTADEGMPEARRVGTVGVIYADVPGRGRVVTAVSMDGIEADAADPRPPLVISGAGGHEAGLLADYTITLTEEGVSRPPLLIKQSLRA